MALFDRLFGFSCHREPPGLSKCAVGSDQCQPRLGDYLFLVLRGRIYRLMELCCQLLGKAG